MHIITRYSLFRILIKGRNIKFNFYTQILDSLIYRKFNNKHFSKSLKRAIVNRVLFFIGNQMQYTPLSLAERNVRCLYILGFRLQNSVRHDRWRISCASVDLGQRSQRFFYSIGQIGWSFVKLNHSSGRKVKPPKQYLPDLNHWRKAFRG